MNRLFIIGIGMGIGTLTEDARNILSQADAVFGAKRMTALVREYGLCRDDVLILDEYRPDVVFRHIFNHIKEQSSNSRKTEVFVRGASEYTGREAIESSDIAASKLADNSAIESPDIAASKFVGGVVCGSADGAVSVLTNIAPSGSTYILLVSGDTGFYSATRSVLRELESLKHLEIIVLPGISSLSYFFAKCALPWQDARLISCHGREGGLVSAVRRNHLTFALTGNNTRELAEMLCEYGFSDLSVHIGENLGSQSERITHTTIADLREKQTSSLTVLIIENPHSDNRLMFGIEDDAFVRGEVPMTKAEIRTQIMAKLQISPRDVCVDIGCGTGSVTVEMGLAAHEGMVYGFDVSDEAVELTKANLKRFRIANADIRKGRAPEILKEVFGSTDDHTFQDNHASPDGESNRADESRCSSMSKTSCMSNSAFPVPDVAFIGGTKGGMTEIVKYLIERNPDIRICTTAIALETALESVKALETLGRTADIVQVQTARAKKVGGLHMMMAQNPIFVISAKARSPFL